MADKLEAEKRELVIGLNSFNQPAELSGSNAWISLITNLLFMKKGSFPSEPEMGCEIQKYDFIFVGEVNDEIISLIKSQVATYLPDIPLTDVIVTTETSSKGTPVLLIVLKFDFTDGEFDTAVVAAEKSENLINFAVSI